MNLDPIIQRLSEAGLPRVESIGGLALIPSEHQYFPATFVVPELQRGEDQSRVTGVFDQLVVCQFLVYLIVGGERASAAQIDSDWRRYSTDIEDALTGWVHPDAEGRATSLVAADALSARGREFGWGMRFRTVRRIRKRVQNPD